MPKDIDLNKAMENKTKCTNCGKILANISKNYYVSNSILNKNTGKMSLCKECLIDIYKELIKETKDIRLALYKLCRLLDLYYTDSLYKTAVAESDWKDEVDLIQNGLEIWKKYIKNINSLRNYKGYTFEHGEQINILKEQIAINDNNNKIAISKMSENEIEQQYLTKKNREDIMNIVGYDPFENDLESDKPKLYAKLVNMLPEDNEDSDMKIGAMISIVKSQNQEDKINDLITSLSADPITLKTEVGTIKSLTDTKEKLNKSALALAKDNKISDLYSGHKSVGANTLSGIMKRIKEIDLDDSQVNLYDIRTSQGIFQVALQSSQAMVESLNFGDDTLLDMVKYQRGKMNYYEKEYSKLAEENRKLRVLCNRNGIDYKEEVIFVEGVIDNLEYNDEIIKKEQNEIDEFNKIVENIKPITMNEYIDEKISEKEEKEKQKILDSIKKE